MQAGDIINQKIDSIGDDGGFSVVTIRAVEGTDAEGNIVLLRGKKERKGIGRADFRLDPEDRESEHDEAAYEARVTELLAEVFGNSSQIAAKLATARDIIQQLRQDKADMRDRIQRLKKRIEKLEAQS